MGGELIIENGGDIFLSIKKDLILSVEAGDNKKFSSLGLNIPVAPGPLGICTSSGICGHSYSMGKADSVCVVSKSTCLADAWSTSIANKIITEEDVEKVLKNYDKDLLSVVAIKNDKIGISGIIELVSAEVIAIPVSFLHHRVTQPSYSPKSPKSHSSLPTSNFQPPLPKTLP
jgi:ApbE superfamily uncharacterized protein (UPF0280 family)